LVSAVGTGSPYVGDILDRGFEQAQAVVVLFTPDDEARLREQYRNTNEKQSEADLKPQPRPNVLFEAGMAFGKNSVRTILVEFGQLRGMSDIAGRHTIRMDNSAERRHELAQRLEDAGCPINRKRTQWLRE